MEDYVKDLERQLANKDIENMKLKDKVECLEDKIDYAINYIDKLNKMTEFDFENEYWMENLIKILKGE